MYVGFLELHLDAGTLSATPGVGRRDHVLLVDDEPMIRSSVQRGLARHGWPVYLAEDGAGAVERFRQVGQRVALVLMDIRMPGVDGLEAARRIRAMDSDTPIVLMTAAVDLGSVSDVDVQACFAKPFSIDDVLGVLDRLRVSEVLPP